MSVNRVTVTADHLIVEPTRLSKVWSFTRRLQFPLEQVRGATFDPGMRQEPTGWRTQFWNVSGYRRAIVVTLGADHPRNGR